MIRHCFKATFDLHNLRKMLFFKVIRKLYYTVIAKISLDLDQRD